MILMIDTSKRSDLLQSLAVIQHLLGSAIAPMGATSAAAAPLPAAAPGSPPAMVAHPLLGAPKLQLDVLRVLAASPAGTLTSHEVAAALGMSQPAYAKKIRGTGRAPNQAQDELYTRGWAYPHGPQSRVRRYEITPEGRRVAALLPPP